MEDGKIKAIGENLEAGEETEIVDAKGLCVYPGFVEAHGHIGLDGYGIGYEGMDYNEMNDIVTPHLRGIDGVKPMDAAFPHAAAAGVTCVCVGREAPMCWAAALPPSKPWEKEWTIW